MNSKKHTLLKKMMTILLAVSLLLPYMPAPSFADETELTPEPSYIVVQKTITGLTAEQIDTLKSKLNITVTSGGSEMYTLWYNQNEGNIQFRETGNTWAWRINGATGGTYTVSESGCEPTDLGLPAGANLNATGFGNVTVDSADIHVNAEKETTCSHVDWPLYEGKFFAGSLTGGNGVVVITNRAPSASQRTAIEAALLGGNWKDPVYYYSLSNLNIDEGNNDPDYAIPIKVMNENSEVTTLTYYPNRTYSGESASGVIEFSNTSVWNHVAAVTYDTEAVKIADIQTSNAYTQPVTLENALKISKTLTGRDWKDTDTFTFSITSDTVGAPMPSKTSVTITGDNGGNAEITADFGSITFNTVGTYVYKIVENPSTVPGVDEDTIAYTVTVNVTDANNDGILEATANYQKSGAEYTYDANDQDKYMAFTNTYNVESATEKLVGHKHLEGKSLASGDFKFYIESVTKDGDSVSDSELDSVPLPTNVSGLGASKAVLNGGTGAASEYEVYFGTLTFDQDDIGHTYTYTIKEVNEGKTGYTYDTSEKTVTYTVTEGKDGDTPCVEVAVTKDTSASENDEHGYFVFSNSYSPAPATLVGSTDLKISKSLTGREWKDTDKFTFTITADDGTPMPANTTVEINGNNGGSEPITANFGNITFTQAGTYTYTINEDATTIEGVSEDKTEYTVTVDVVDNNGQLEAIASYKADGKDYTYNEAMAFTNTYSPAPATLVGSTDLKISKSLTGREWKDTDKFTFTITADDGTPMPANTTVEINGNNGGSEPITANFGNITFTQAGTYTYTINEDATTIEGVSEDKTEYTVTVDVVDNNGQLEAVASYKADGKDYTYNEAMAFTNTYTAQSATAAPEFTKTLNGRDMAANESFGFTLTADENNPEGATLPAQTTATVSDARDGIEQPISFGDITFTKAGTYTFYVQETSWNGKEIEKVADKQGLTFDAKQHSVTYTVTDNGKGQLIAQASYSDNDQNIENSYTEPGTVTITPADIIVYTGGDEYAGVVDGTGSIDKTQDGGLPTPGYLITLPADIDEIYFEGSGVAADLSQRVRFIYDGNEDGKYDCQDDRIWELSLYSEGSYMTSQTSPVDGIARYVYRMEKDSITNTPIRMQFTDKDGNVTTSDDFTINANELYQVFEMSIYSGGLDRGKIKAEILDQNGDVVATRNVEVGKANLIIRGTTNEEEFSGVVHEESAVSNNKNNITALVPEDAKYVINQSQVSVTSDHVSLLSDAVVDTSILKDYIVDQNIADSDENFEYRYLDLVDTTNGNAYVTADQPIEVYWKLPEGSSSDDNFKVVHFKGLDRQYDDKTEDLIGTDGYEVEEYSAANKNLSIVTINGEGYLKFSVDSFSPFVLVWSEADNYVPPVIVPGGDDTPDLNTTDHFSYIVGYPEDYRTGEPTEDEDLWPVKPQGNITRAEVATIFYRLLKDEVREENWTQSNDYTDVSADDWFNAPVSTLGAMGIVVGYEDGSFRPNAPITRAEFAAIAVRFFEEDSAIYEEGTFSDIAGGEWFADAVQAAKDHSIIGGYPDGSFQPNKNISRAEACSIVNRTLDRIPHEDHLLPVAEMNNWPDNLEGAWYYADMQEATNGHEYKWITDNGKTVEDWTGELPEIDWAEVERELCELHGVPYKG